jgi:hypothetical protein
MGPQGYTSLCSVRFGFEVRLRAQGSGLKAQGSRLREDLEVKRSEVLLKP